MTTPACPRLFEAEAMRDGRLAGTELASFARHTTNCRACRHEVRSLDALGEALRASPGEARADELRRLRERTRLMAAFDATLVAPRRSGGRRRVLWPATFVAAAVLAGIFVLGRARSRSNVELTPTVVVRAVAASVWSRHTEDGREAIRLERGELWIRVDHTRTKTGLIVRLPDGELEDTGTTFTVSAADGRTTRVAVEEGRVLLRLRGRPAVAIGRAETWAPQPPTLPSPTPSRPAATSPPHRTRTAARAPDVSAGGTSPGSPAVTPDHGETAFEFRAAVTLLDGGANRAAAAAFARFVTKHPGDPRAEDAAYLRVIALQRCGAGDEMSGAAQDYLRLYPAGFRHAEMAKLSP
jgi:hypothetical protein